MPSPLSSTQSYPLTPVRRHTEAPMAPPDGTAGHSSTDSIRDHRLRYSRSKGKDPLSDVDAEEDEAQGGERAALLGEGQDGIAHLDPSRDVSSHQSD